MDASRFYPKQSKLSPQGKIKVSPPDTVNVWLGKAKTSCTANLEPLTLLLDIDSAVKINERASDCDEHSLQHTPERMEWSVYFSPSNIKELLQLQLNGHNLKVLSCGDISKKDLHLIFAQYGVFLSEDNVQTVAGNKAAYVEGQGYDKSHLFLTVNSSSHKSALKTVHGYFIGTNASFPRFS